MRRANAVSGIVLGTVAILMMAVIIPWQIEPGPAGMMSPRLVPDLMMGAILCLSVLLVATNLRDVEGDGNAPGALPEASPIVRADLAALAKIGAVFVAALLLFNAVSPLAGGAGLMIGGFLVLGERRPLLVIGLTAALLFCLWVLFYVILGTAIL